MFSRKPHYAINAIIVAKMTPMHILPSTNRLTAALSVSSGSGSSCVVVDDGRSGPVKPNDGFSDDASVSGSAVTLLVDASVVSAAVDASGEPSVGVAVVSP